MPINANRIHKPAGKLRKLLRKLPKNPGPDEIRSLRTNARRFETIIDALGPEAGGKTKQLLRDLAQLRKRAGKVRDTDVLISYALTVNINGEQNCLLRLIETLGAKRVKYVKKLRFLVIEIGPRLQRKLKRTASNLEKALDSSQVKQTDSAAKVSSKAIATAIRDVETLKTPRRLGKGNLHSYRLKVKELRYVLQLSDNANQ